MLPHRSISSPLLLYSDPLPINILTHKSTLFPLIISTFKLLSKIHSAYASSLLNPFRDPSINKRIKSTWLEKEIDELMLSASSDLFLSASPLALKDPDLV